ncbi:MAG: trimethylamine methyltransferase family protein, partial [Anaerolineales bacterium]|nr:trimethylamine methyltransferase family protein [Anaerolineales bacterium]
MPGGAQAGHEKTLTALIAAMSGNNVLYGAGMLECGMVVDYSQLLLDSDIISMVMYLLGGVEVSDET